MLRICSFTLFAVASLAAVLTISADDAPKRKAELPPLSPQAQRAADRLQESLPPKSEARLMFDHILAGSRMGPDEGWFRMAKAKTRFGWEYVAKTFDRDGDEKVSGKEFGGERADFLRLDRDGDRALTADDFDFSKHAMEQTAGLMLFSIADRDGDGHVTKEEFAVLFAALDSGDRGYLSLDDVQYRFEAPDEKSQRARSGGPDRNTLLLGLARQEIGSLQPGPDLNEEAPDFTLPAVNGKQKVTLAEQIGERPVVLVFGNFTCGPFRSQSGNVNKLYERYKDRATFLMVYVREAHPEDGWASGRNRALGVALKQPTTDEERHTVAHTCQTKLSFQMPFLVDSIDDKVGAVYSGMPSRLYVIDADGRVAYKSGRGPFGFKPAECEQSLILLLQQQETKADAAENR